MSDRTIVLLSARRTGSHAMFRVFQKHPEVMIAHVQQQIGNWETNFWNLAARAIDGDPEPFRTRFSKSHPYLGGWAPSTALEAFELWDEVLVELGPNVFDRSTAYLNSRCAIELMMRYAQSHDVRVFGLVRDARDAIASQLNCQAGKPDGDSPAYREKVWLDQYERLEKLRDLAGIPVWRYEDIASDPDRFMPDVMDYCGLDVIPDTWSHISPVNVARRSRPADAWWKPSVRLMTHLQRFGYLEDSSMAA